MFIKLPKKEDKKHKLSVKKFKEDFISGLHLIRDSKVLKIIVSLAIIVNFSAAPMFSVGITFLVKEVLMQSNFRLGFLHTILSLSMIISPIVFTKKLKKMKFGESMIKLFLGTGILIVLISVSVQNQIFSLYQGSVSYGIVVLLCFFIGMLVTAINISVGTLMQKTVPLEYMGRASTTLSLFATIAVPLGQMFFGYLYDIINPGIVIILNGLIIIIAISIYYHRLREIDNEEQGYIKKVSIERSVMVNEV